MINEVYWDKVNHRVTVSRIQQDIEDRSKLLVHRDEYKDLQEMLDRGLSVDEMNFMKLGLRIKSFIVDGTYV